MGFVLHSRAGDSQSLKACIAAVFSNASLEFKKVDGLGGAPGGATRQLLVGTQDVVVSDPNAMAELLGGESVSGPSNSFAIQDWLEWETSQLRPAVYSDQRASVLPPTLAKLTEVLSKKKFIMGDGPTLADIVVFSTLLPIAEELPEVISKFLKSMGALEQAKKGVEQALAGDTQHRFGKVLADDIAFLKAKQPILPIPGQRNILITSALPYVNNVPHLGNIIGCVLSADVYARFCRARGHNTIYICGTDEYGTATETKAYEEGVTCQEICDKYHAIHKGIYDWFDISCDKFGRTPTRHQTKICQDIFWSLKEKDQLIEEEMQQLYSEALGKFLNDRLVTGICPKCKYEDARGDQCDNCGALLNPTELIDPKCSLTGTTPVLRTTRHVFLDLPKLSEKLQAYIDTTSQLGGWSSNCVQVTRAWMRDGLKPRCITRDLKWGTSVPLEGFTDKVFYVWFDAPIGYLSITASYTPDWEKWWKNPKDVECVQFMGKDNVPFHTVIFPATLLGTGEEWTMMKNISVTEYLNYEGGKFSKSRSTGVFGNDAKETGIPVEVWRYYLLANRPEQQDTDFMWVNLASQNNNELLKNLGNFVNRSLKFVEKFFGSVVPESSEKGQDIVAALGKELTEKVKEYVEKMEKIQIRPALFTAMDISSLGNKFLQDNKAWELVKTDEPLCRTLIATGVGMARVLAAVFQPFMPSLTEKILKQLNLGWEATSLTQDEIAKMKAPDKLVPAGHKIVEPAPLFTKISDEEVEAFKDRFKGPQVADAASASTTQKGKGKQKGGENSGSKSNGDVSQEKGGKKDKKEKKEKKEKAAPKKPAEDRAVDVSRLDLRVGHINKAWRHPDADSLYVEEVDVGEEQPRTVVSGLVKFIPEDQMQNRRVVLVCNLKPVNMRGIKSHAMVLAATSTDGTTVELVEPPEGVALGEPVTVAGFEGEPDAVLNPKKKVFETVQPDLATNGERVACYKGVPFSTTKGLCTVKSISGGSIK
ncbi:hypothetical protein BSKO_07860 [Bryopsis sp. KO-2023]|nr:hypothetical protein BSKO_07860 [Bryopsis sp. KO-2023]